MAVYVVTWNLNKEGSAYSDARAAFLKQLGKYDNCTDSDLETVRFISTTETANQIDEYLRRAMDTDDRLFVSRVIDGQHQGWLSQTTWDWIHARL